MNKHLVSENFFEFFNSVSEPVNSVEEIFMLLNKNLHLLVDDLNIGQWGALLILPRSEAAPEGLRKSVMTYVNPKGFGGETFEKTYTTGDNGSVVFRANAVSGAEWEEDDLVDIEFLADQIFVLASRARITSLVAQLSMGQHP